MTVFVIFSKNIQKIYINCFSQKLKFPTLYLGSSRVLSRIPTLASKYDYSILCSFRDMTFYVIFSKVFFLKHKLIFFSKSEVPNPIVGYCQSTIKDCESCPQLGLLKSL